MYFLFISEVKDSSVNQQGSGLEVFIQELISGLVWAAQVTDKVLYNGQEDSLWRKCDYH